MDQATATIIAQNFADVVKQRFTVSQSFLFGSFAKGNFHEESDIDIAVVFKDYGNVENMRLELMRIRRKIDSRIEPHLFTQSDFILESPLVYDICKYGVALK